MASSHAAALRRLRESAARFDDTGRKDTAATLAGLAARPLPAGPAMAQYHALLLFLRAHPGDAKLLARVEGEFRRIARAVRRWPAARREALANEGLPFGDTVTRFSHDQLRQLLQRSELRVRFDHAGQPQQDLNNVLRLTLPAPEWAHTAKGLADDELLAELRVRPADRLPFVVNELARLDGQPFVKDHLFDALDLFVRVSGRRAAFSKAFNRLPMPAVFWQEDRVRRFDTMALMNRRLPRPRRLEGASSSEVVMRTLRDTLTLTGRETDPGTYLEPRSLRLYDLERGISVALYGMVPDRQLPYESYVGFMLFKNGMPAAYGGSWVFGARADFGMNIFEPYRGGESGFMMCQVLRVYRQAFGVRCFEVDAHQFGLDNPDGIASGAFWFYHRHGFRPVDPALAQQAEREARRLAATPGARSSDKTLVAFTASSVALDFSADRRARPPLALATWTDRITAHVARRFGGERQRAQAVAMERMARLGAPLRAPKAPGAERVAAEMALLAAALGVDDAPRLRLLQRLVRLKMRDVYGYQRALLRFLGQA
ncbi:MAG: hypothetical protein JNL30_09775 [Rubrivivax sp.]|nr:hypothetical protein [Rubrivivax sp.]